MSSQLFLAHRLDPRIRSTSVGFSIRFESAGRKILSIVRFSILTPGTKMLYGAFFLVIHFGHEILLYYNLKALGPSIIHHPPYIHTRGIIFPLILGRCWLLVHLTAHVHTASITSQISPRNMSCFGWTTFGTAEYSSLRSKDSSIYIMDIAPRKIRKLQSPESQYNIYYWKCCWVKHTQISHSRVQDHRLISSLE